MTNNLVLRVLSGLVLAPLALGAAWLGGWAFTAFWAAAAVAVIVEWVRLVGLRNIPWVACGFVYGAVMFAAPMLLRNDPVLGFESIVFLFLVVWATDIAAYFGGHALGGPKLAISISPNKTWSGAIIGTAAAVAIAIPFAKYVGLDQRAVALLAFALSVAAQLGDLMESALKRRFHAKDASHLIPGHGGVMDRLDGFWAAVLVAAGIGVARGGLHGAQGLLVW
jgi:phosphatidate cytidylyltransferase